MHSEHTGFHSVSIQAKDITTSKCIMHKLIALVFPLSGQARTMTKAITDPTRERAGGCFPGHFIVNKELPIAILHGPSKSSSR